MLIEYQKVVVTAFGSGPKILQSPPPLKESLSLVHAVFSTSENLDECK